MNELHLFAGAGGGILGGMLLGHTCVCAVELNKYCQQVLLQRQRDGYLPRFPIWNDVQTFDGKPWRGRVDIVCGGFPCQDISAGGGGAGIDGARSGMWHHMARIIGEIRPRYVFVENSPMLTLRGLGRVLGDLAAMGYDARWGVLGAHHVGAPHKRDRIWIVATDSLRFGLQGRDGSIKKIQREIKNTSIQALVQNPAWPDLSNPRAYGSNDGVANRVERTKAIGNGQIPSVAALAFKILSVSLDNKIK